jgi:hypothetical protein
MKRLLTLFVCAAALGLAQQETPAPAPPPQPKHEAEAKPPKWLQKVFDIKYADPKTIADVLNSLRQSTVDAVNYNRDLHVVSVGTHDPAFLELAQEIIRRYDVVKRQEADRDVEVTVSILLASPKSTGANALPPDLEGVARQLHNSLGINDIRLLDTAIMRSREGKYARSTGMVESVLPGVKRPSSYEINYMEARADGEAPKRTIRFSTFQLQMNLWVEDPVPDKVPSGRTENISFRTDLSLTDGQKAVVGKSRIGAGDASLILVVSARVME